MEAGGLGPAPHEDSSAMIPSVTSGPEGQGADWPFDSDSDPDEFQPVIEWLRARDLFLDFSRSPSIIEFVWENHMLSNSEAPAS